MPTILPFASSGTPKPSTDAMIRQLTDGMDLTLRDTVERVGKDHDKAAAELDDMRKAVRAFVDPIAKEPESDERDLACYSLDIGAAIGSAYGVAALAAGNIMWGAIWSGQTPRTDSPDDSLTDKLTSEVLNTASGGAAESRVALAHGESAQQIRDQALAWPRELLDGLPPEQQAAAFPVLEVGVRLGAGYAVVSSLDCSTTSG